MGPTRLSLFLLLVLWCYITLPPPKKEKSLPRLRSFFPVSSYRSFRCYHQVLLHQMSTMLPSKVMPIHISLAVHNELSFILILLLRTVTFATLLNIMYFTRIKICITNRVIRFYVNQPCFPFSEKCVYGTSNIFPLNYLSFSY